MVKILLPTMAVYKEDVEVMLGLLERMAGGRVDVGLEIIGEPEHFQSEEHLNRIKENIISLAEGAYLVVHGFSGIEVYESGLADMRTVKGKELLETYLKLGGDIGAAYVHVHGGAAYRGKELHFQEKEKDLEKVRKNLLDSKCRLDVKCKLGIENLPTPSVGDLNKDPKKVWRDCVESISDCLYVVGGTDLKVTFDTCHYAAGRTGAIDLVGAVKKLGEYLGLVHVGDISGFWKPYKLMWREGIIPGEGRLGGDSFRNFFGYIKGKYPDIGVCIEVYNKDFKDPQESKEAITRILN